MKKVLPYFLMLEGLDHFIFSTIGVVGLSVHHVFDFYSWLTPVVDYVMGAGTLVGGWLIHKRGK